MFNKNRKILHYSLITIALVSAMVFICEEAFARAGGGGSYSGGGGGSSSSSGGGSGILGLIFRILFRLIWEFLRYLCKEYPAIGYPLSALFIIGIVGLVLLGIISEVKEKKNLEIDPYKDDGISPYESSNVDSAFIYENQAVSDIKGKDPDFNEKVFCSRAKKAFLAIQSAWSKRDLSKAEQFLADGTYEQFLIQLGIMKENHLIDVMENLKILDASVVGYESDNGIDTIFLAITASGKNYFADDRTNKYVKGDKKEETFTEIWTFLRRTGVKTLGKPGLIEGYCPNCGNKISIGRHTNCSSCGCLLRSGEHDWILSNITQECEWTRHNNKLIPGVKKYISFDPGFNVQHIEDLVSMMFWRKVSSDRKQNIASFRKIATDEYCDKLKKSYDNKQEFKYYDDCAVGSVKVLAIDTEKSEKEDFIYVEVAWDGIQTTLKDKEQNIFNTIKNWFKKRKLNRNVFLLKRKRGVMTDTKKGLCAAPCPNCGAMESHSTNNECEYCGAVMNDGNRDWVVEDILSIDDLSIDNAISRARRAITKPIKFNGYSYKGNNKASNNTNTDNGNNSPNVNSVISNMNQAAVMTSAAAGGIIGAAANSNNIDLNQVTASLEDHIKWLIGMMLVDGEVNKNEFGIICDHAETLGIDENRVSLLVKQMLGQSRPIEYLINNVPIPQGNEFMQVLIRVIFADGRIAKEELNMLRYIAKRINFSEIKLRELFEKEKARFNENRNTKI